MNKERRPDGQIGAAQSDARNHNLNLTVGAGTDRAWTWEEVVRLHALGVSLIPLRGKKPCVKWRRGSADFVHQQPTLVELKRWSALHPDAWAITGGGPARWVCLDVEAAGVEDAGEAGRLIKTVVSELPASCRRLSPSGGVHAWLQVIDGPAPPATGAKLALRTGPTGNVTLLAELRTEGHYAVILGPGRGPLPPTFAPHPVTTLELEDLTARIRAVSDRPRRARATHLGAGEGVATLGSWLSRFTPRDPCRTVSKQAAFVAKQLATDTLTPAILGPVLQLVRLAHTGHTGVSEALESIGEDFIGRAALRGPERGSDAHRQWNVSLSRALREVGAPRWLLEGRDRVCGCWLDSLMAAYDGAPVGGLRSPNSRSRTYDRQILEHLVHKAKLNRSAVVREARRQIAEATDISTKTVSKALTRLQDLGWIAQSGPARSLKAITLVKPVTTTTTTEPSSGSGSSVVVVPAHGVHRLFGPAGFGPGVAETFAHLPEWRRPLRARTGHLVRVTPGSSAARGAVKQDRRSIPGPPPGQGVTVADIVEVTGKAASTVRNHLRRLEAGAAAFEDGERRWWRYHFNADWLAETLGIVDTAEARKRLHDRERRLHYKWRVTTGKSAKAHIVDDGKVFFTKVVDHVDTGEILWIDDAPDDTLWIGHAGEEEKIQSS